MQKFDNFSPEVGIYGDTGSVPVINPADNSRSGRRSASGDADSSRSNSPGKKSEGRGTKKSGNGKNTPQKDDIPPLTERIKNFFHNPTLRVLTGIFLLFLAAYLIVCIISYVNTCFVDQAITKSPKQTEPHAANYGGIGGAWLSEILIDEGFGIGSAIVVFWLVMMSLKLLTKSKAARFKSVNFTIKCLIALLTTSLIIGLLTIGLDVPFNLGGAHGRYVNQLIIDYIGWIGAALLCLFMLILFVSLCLNDVVQWILRKKRERDARLAKQKAEKEAELARLQELERMKEEDLMDDARAGEHENIRSGEDKSDKISNVDFEDSEKKEVPVSPEEEDMTYVYEDDLPETSETLLTTPAAEPKESDSNTVEDEDSAKRVMQVNVNHIATVEEDKSKLPQKADAFHFPPVALLRKAPEQVVVDNNEQVENEEKIRRTLLDFGIPITDISATIGPTVTLYEIIPEPGIKISSIRSREEDIARSLSANGVRIIAPMPGKGTVGIEVPNKDPQIVPMRTVITSRKFQESNYELPIALGSTISNEVYIADLAKMPHLLVAGATGQGKSVGLNAIITSLLYRKNPSELKFVMIDPKMVELSLYSSIEKHYLARMSGEEEAIITDVNNKVIPVLSSLCVEMGERYELLKSARVRAIKEYNEKFKRGELSEADGHRFMPYIVVIVDEYSDLVMTAGKEVEKPLARLAQKARAIGIHLIVATQRPSTDVVTGMIKANFPARIAFKVSSGVDSKTILNTTAAYKLIGRGDMLIATGSELVRVQCAYIETPEVEDVCTFISQQPCESETYILPEPLTGGEREDGGGFEDNQPLDPLLAEVARQIINLDQASTSGIQRRYNIGYNRAGRIMDQLERVGVVGPSQGGKPRAVLVDQMALESILQRLGVS